MSKNPYGSNLFADCDVLVEVLGERNGFRTLVSEYGVMNCDFTAFSEDLIAELGGKECRVTIAGEISLKGRIVRDEDRQGVHFSIRFEELDQETSSFLRHEINKQKLQSPWKRAHRRYKGADAFTNVEQPTEVVFNNLAGAPVLRVVNYSREGILLESKVGLERLFSINDEVEFTIRTNYKNTLEEVEAIVVRVSDEIDAQGRRFYRYGLQLTRFNADSLQKFLYLLSTVEAAADSDISLVSINTYEDIN